MILEHYNAFYVLVNNGEVANWVSKFRIPIDFSTLIFNNGNRQRRGKKIVGDK
jgi:hypothetical protein